MINTVAVFLGAAVNAFTNDNGVVDQDTNHNQKAKHRQHVQTDVERA